MRCGERFKSKWSGNRICPDCSEENRELGPWAEGVTERSHLESNISLWTVIDTNQLKAAAKARHVVMQPWVKHMFADSAKERVTAAPSQYRHIEHNLADSKIEYGSQVKGLIISSSHLLPHPCDIQPLPDDILKIRSALRRRNLQCFEVSEPLTEAQIAELDKGLEDCHSWILLSPKVGIDTELFENSVIEQ